ncbi:MAG: hypothetical protein HC861_01025 [Rhodospirillaceae bacterium]|nr:hypothetical protein [Rhodospirillaceae bacterium]
MWRGRAWAAEQIKIRDLYKTQAEFSERAVALQGQEIEIPGFMAPPLKPDARFFVLTKRPMSVCPFCDTAADWPLDIVLVLLREQQEWVYFNRPIIATGVLELGVAVDAETGFVSKVRLADAGFELVG